jgi:hypothetical protein
VRTEGKAVVKAWSMAKMRDDVARELLEPFMEMHACIRRGGPEDRR